jgi:hypothetical protein
MVGRKKSARKKVPKKKRRIALKFDINPAQKRRIALKFDIVLKFHK